MEGIETIVRYLNRSGPTSGSELGEALGISRMAVQKRIQALIDMGLPVSATRGVGYILDSDVGLLQADQIESLLIPTIADLTESVEVFQSIESTNSYLLTQSFEPNRARVLSLIHI